MPNLLSFLFTHIIVELERVRFLCIKIHCSWLREKVGKIMHQVGHGMDLKVSVLKVYFVTALIFDKPTTTEPSPPAAVAYSLCVGHILGMNRKRKKCMEM